MGPITLFDKSFLQSLSLDESVWFDNFFLTNIAPIFYIETLADLEKAVRKGRTPEQEVGIIADKTPERHSNPNIFHQNLAIANLDGHDIVMDGRPIIGGGRPVMTGDKRAIIFNLPKEREAFERWQKGEFLEVERLFAKAWRAILRSLNFEAFLPIFGAIGIQPKCYSLEEAKLVAESIVRSKDNQKELFFLTFKLLFIPEEICVQALKRWIDKGSPPLRDFAPYVAHVLTVEIFFYIAINSNLISKKINSKTDFAYLFYLPFCMVFVSSDNLHRRCAPFFLRDDQEFVWGPDLKIDLEKIDEFFDALPDIEKEKGLYKIATYPPDSKDSLTAHLWDRFLPKWRDHKIDEHPIPGDKAEEKRIIDEIKKTAEGAPIDPKTADFNTESADAIILKKSIRKKKGKWWQVPKDL